PAPAESAPVDWARVVALVWLAGAAVVLLRLALGTLAVWRIARRSTRVSDPTWLALVQRTARELGLLRPVTLLAGRTHSVPLTWGIVYPVVLLPAGADAWSEERRRLVLVHEMSHVDRLDALTQLVAQIGLALFWFNPLLWMAISRMRAERERACDDRVIAAGTRASLYADDLLTIVRTLEQRTGPAFAALAMARRSELEGRLLAILDPSVRRERVGRRGALAVATTALALVLPLSALRPWRAEAAEPSLTPVPTAAQAGASDRPSVPEATANAASAAPIAVPIPPAATTTRLAGLGATASPAPAVTRASGSRECRRAAYTGPGYDYHVGSGRHTNMHIVDDDGGQHVATVLIVDDTLCLFMDMTGKVKFNEDETDVAGISSDGHVTIERSQNGREQRLEIVPDGRGGLSRRYLENGREADPSAARAMLAELIPGAARELALDPNGRVARLRRRGGIANVLRDIALVRSDDAKRKYYDALITSGRVPADTLSLIARAVASAISSDGDKAYVLQRIDEQREATPAVHTAVADAARTISSDGDKRRVLESAIARGGTAVPAYAVASIASGISSDGDKAAVLRQIADRYDGSDSLRTAFFSAANSIASDTDHGRVLMALLQRPQPLDRASVIALLRSARDIASDSQKGAVLAAVVDDKALVADPAVRTAFFDALDTVASDYNHSRVLLGAIAQSPASAELTRRVLSSARHISSDHDKANVLSALARSAPLSDASIRSEFIAVLKTMSSDSEYRRVMDQLEK
ncbi:MAG TPA: M56 family metallopeptidase, partial [Gemmatimonadaceae bacterium]|nr:M56 family metallopeptidase [Gemmatimonadaceae bacterium]